MPNPTSPTARKTGFDALLRHQEEMLRQGEPAVHVAVVDRTVLSYGAGVHETADYLRRASAAGLPVVQRRSGGTGIVHAEGDLAWAVVLPRSDPRVGRDFVHAYPRLGAGLVRLLAAHGVEGHWRPAPGLSEACCPLSARGEVLEVEGRIVGAAAQHVTGRALLHHGTLSVTVDRDLVGRVFAFEDPGLVERLAGFAEFSPRADSECLETELERILRDAWTGAVD
jgi:lipoate-protein ligase A